MVTGTTSSKLDQMEPPLPVPLTSLLELVRHQLLQAGTRHTVKVPETVEMEMEMDTSHRIRQMIEHPILLTTELQ